MPLGPEEIYLYARHAGFSPDQAVTMTAVAMAESGGVLTAHNPNGEDSRGLWQVNLEAHPKFHGLDASDPLTNARMAFEVSGGGADIGRWTVTHGDKGAPYLKYREQAEAAARAFGEDAHGNWNPPANYHAPKQGAGPPGGPPPPADLPTALPDDGDADFTPAFGGEGGNLSQSPAGFAQQPAAATATQPQQQQAVDPDADIGQDNDGDGLLDRYEKMIGTNPLGIDSDNDGFTDRDEILEFRTDATDFGSNPLGATGGTTPFGQARAPAPPAPVPVPIPNTPVSPAGDLSDVGVAPDLSDVGVAPGAAPGAAPPVTAQPAAAQPINVMQSQQMAQAGGPSQGGGNTLDVFLDAALAQDGKPYVFGTEAAGDDLDPDALDCSELVEWAGTQAGVKIPDGSFNQYLHTKQLGGEMTVEEALRTPGALLFKFSSTPVPGGGRPSTAHVAISLGDGRTIEARSSSTGTGIMDAGDIEWTHAGVVPDLGTELSGDFGPGVVTAPLPPVQMGTDSDGDGLLDAYEQMIGADPFNADTDRDGFVDSVEILEHRSDPLDFTDNALTPGATAGYRPPLTNALHTGAGLPGERTGNQFGDVGNAPGFGSSSSSFGQRSGDSGGFGQGNGQGSAPDQAHDHSSHDHSSHDHSSHDHGEGKPDLGNGEGQGPGEGLGQGKGQGQGNGQGQGQGKPAPVDEPPPEEDVVPSPEPEVPPAEVPEPSTEDPVIPGSEVPEPPSEGADTTELVDPAAAVEEFAIQTDAGLAPVDAGVDTTLADDLLDDALITGLDQDGVDTLDDFD